MVTDSCCWSTLKTAASGSAKRIRRPPGLDSPCSAGFVTSASSISRAALLIAARVGESAFN